MKLNSINFDEFKKFMKKLNIKTHNLNDYIKKSTIKKMLYLQDFVIMN